VWLTLLCLVYYNLFVLYFEACLQIINTVLITCMIMLDNKAWWLSRIVMTYTTGPDTEC